MANVISFGLQKGGVGKSTTTSITSYLLSKKYRVLAIDFDSQGNLTRLLSGRSIYDFEGNTILEALCERDLIKYIHTIHERLHILPAEDALAILPNRLTSMYRTRKDQLMALRKLLAPIQNDYDYILIDLPPNLGDQTLNGLVASDYTVVVLQTEPFAFDALDRYLKTLMIVREDLNPDLTFGGILTCLMQSQTNIDRAIREQTLEDYKDLVFNTVIKRRARVKEFVWTGISEATKADRDGLKNYKDFVKELLERVN